MTSPPATGVNSRKNDVVVGQRGLPGMPSPKIVIRSRCISFVPPPNVRMCIERNMRSTRPRTTAPGESPESGAWSRITSISKRAASM